ncbi:MAG: hypothetical protein QM817_32915 [Archangium sp.]
MITVVTDGAGAERTGRPGGWAFIIVRGDEILAQGTGREAKTSSLVMELTAALRGLEAAKPFDEELQLVTDSSIAIDVAKGTFLPKPARYHALCHELRAAFLERKATARWVKGHSGDKWNELVDQLAGAARDEVREISSQRSSQPAK